MVKLKYENEIQTNIILDVNPKKIDPKKNAQYVIERVADFGNDKEVRWVLDFYDKKLLRKIIAKSRCLRPETKILWMLILKK